MTSPQPRIHDLRATCIWTDGFLDLLEEGGAGGSGALAALGDRDAFADLHNRTRVGETPEGLMAPWPGPAGQLFWTYYSDKRRPGDVTGRQSWRWLIPLRSAVMAPGAPEDSRLWAEGFFYPHGVALLTTFSLAWDFSLEEAVAAAMRLRHEAVFLEAGARHVKLDAWANTALQQLRARVLGGKAGTAKAVAEAPITVATVVRAAGVNPVVKVAANSLVHRSLDALAGWSPTWKADALPSLTSRAIPTRQAPPSHILYGKHRGRSIWFPARFEASKPLLSCYHRNLTLASLQVDSLMGLVSAAAARREDGGAWPPALYDCCARAADLLGRLYSGRGDIYRTRSVKVQIDDDPRRAALDVVRAAVGMKPL